MKVEFEHLGRPVVINGLDGDHITNTIVSSDNFYEPDMLAYIADLAPTGTIIDVGANIGNHSVFFGLFTPADKIIAVEPFPIAAEFLSRNITANNLGEKIVQLTCAVGATSGMVGIKPGKRSNIGHTKVTDGADVQLRTLDEIAADEPVSLIKIDVEGYETEVLKGAVKILGEQHPLLFLEAATMRSKKRLDSFLASFGYISGPVFNWTPTYLYSEAA